MKSALTLLSIILIMLAGCKTTNDLSHLKTDDQIPKDPVMSEEEFETTLELTEEAVGNQGVKNLAEITQLKSNNTNLTNMDSVTVGDEEIPTEEILIDEEEEGQGANIRDGIVDNAKASFAAMWNDPNQRVVITAASVGAITALVFNQMSQRSASYYRNLVGSMNNMTDRMIRKSSGGDPRMPHWMVKSFKSTKSGRFTFKYGAKSFKSLNQSIGMTGFKPATLAIGSSVLASSLSAFWAWSDFDEEEIEDIEGDEPTRDRLGQTRQYSGKDKIADVTKNLAFLLQWNDQQKQVFYKAAVSDIVARIPEVAKQNNGKILADTIIPFDPFTVIERINASQAAQFPTGYLGTRQKIEILRGYAVFAAEFANAETTIAPPTDIDLDEMKARLSDKERRIIKLVEGIDAIIAANFILAEMKSQPNLSNEEAQKIDSLISENKNLLQWVERNFR